VNRSVFDSQTLEKSQALMKLKPTYLRKNKEQKEIDT